MSDEDRISGTERARLAALRILPLDRYRDYRPAGEGGMGIVYWAVDSDLNREVALKIVRPDTTSAAPETPEAPLGLSPPGKDTPASKAFETLKARFLQEAWVTGGMAHPGIVPVYELGQTPEGVPYYTMRFVKGNRTLTAAIDEAEGRPVEDRIPLLEPFLKVCDTISYAHAHGVIHRDLKPENVALGEFGEVVVLDWGLAKTRDGPDVSEALFKDRIREYREATDLRTLAGAMGTPGYMSPEAALGRSTEVDERSDVYSLGTILFQLLVGRLPFEFETYIELVRKLKADAPPDPRSIDPGVPEGLADICLRALAREPNDRPKSAEVLAEEVRKWQAMRAADLEIAGLLREAKGALAGAADLTGDALVRQLDRAGAACSQVLAKRPDDAGATRLQEELDRLRERGIAERERAARGRVLRRGGVVLLIVATVVTIFVAIALEDRRRRAENAERIAANERDEKDAAYRRAEGLRLAAQSQAVLEADAELALSLAVEAGELHDGPQVLTALQDAVRRHRGRRSLPGHASRPGFSPDSRFVVTSGGGEVQVVNVGTGEIEVRFLEQGLGGFDAAASRLVTLRGGGFTVWETDRWEPLLEVDPEKEVWSARLSPDGETVVSLGREEDHDVRVWDVGEGGPPRLLEGHTGSLESATFSPDGRRLLTTSQVDRTARLWEIATGRQLLLIRGDDDDLEEVGPDGERETIAWYHGFFTTDGSRIVTHSANGTLRVWDSETGEPITTLTELARHVTNAVAARDRDRVYVLALPGGRPNAYVWEVRTGRLTVLKTRRQGSIRAAGISADGEQVFLTRYQEPLVHLLNASTGEEVHTLGVPGEMQGSAAFSPDGRWIAATADGRALRLWDARNQEERSTFDPTLSGSIRTACLSRDGLRLTTFGRHDGVAIVREVDSGRMLGRIGIDVTRDGWGKISPEGSAAVHWRSGEEGPRIAGVPTGRELVDLGRLYGLDPLCFSRDGGFLAALVQSQPNQDREDLLIVDLTRGRVSAKLPIGAVAADFDRAGRRLAVSISEWTDHGPRSLLVCEAPSGETTWRHPLPDGDTLHEIEFAAAGKRILALGDEELFVLDVGAEGHLLRWACEDWISDAGISADGARIFTTVEATHVRDATTGRSLFEVPGYGADPASICWSPSGRRLLTADWDGIARVRDGDTGEVLLTLTGHEMPLHSAAFSDDGRRIVTTSYDLTARVWDAKTGRELLRAAGHRNERVRSFRFLPSSGNVLTLFTTDRVEIRDPESWELVARLRVPLQKPLLSQDGTLLARLSGSSIYSTATGERVARFGDPEAWTGILGFGPGARVLTVDLDGVIRICDANTGRESAALVTDLPANRIRARFTPGGSRVLVKAAPASELVFDASSGDRLDRNWTPLEETIWRSNPDRMRPAGGFLPVIPTVPGQRTLGRVVRIVSLSTGEETARLEGHLAGVNSAAVGPSGRLVVTASADRTARVWDLGTGEELMALAHPEAVGRAEISPDGSFVVTLSQGKLRRFPMDPLAHAQALDPRPLTAAERRRFEIGVSGEPVPTGGKKADEDPGGRKLFERLLEESGDEAAVRQRLETDASLDPAARASARKIRLRPAEHGLNLNGRAYRIAIVRGKAAGEYLQALRMAEIAVRFVPENGRVLATLGKAKFRTGAAREALPILRRADRINTAAEGHGIPTDVAFLAMACLALDRREEAEVEYARFRKLVTRPEYNDSPSRRTLKPVIEELRDRFD